MLLTAILSAPQDLREQDPGKALSGRIGLWECGKREELELRIRQLLVGHGELRHERAERQLR
jgi:hypothetical protein